MIHHVSIPARDPQTVARVLAELTGWKARPFLGPVPGAVMLLAEDGRGTAIEIYPDGVTISPGEIADQSHFPTGQSADFFPFHLLLSLEVEPDHVLRVAERAGWRALRCWRGPPTKPVFELIEFWVENRLMLEIATPEMLPNYLAIATAEAHDRAIAAMGARAPEAV